MADTRQALWSEPSHEELVIDGWLEETGPYVTLGRAAHVAPGADVIALDDIASEPA